VAAPDNGFSFEIEPGIERVVIAGTGLAAETLRDGNLVLYFGDKTTRHRISAGHILSGRADPAAIEGRIALIGVSANGSERMYGTPTGERMASGAIAANAIDQIIDQSFLTRPGWASVAEQAFTLFAGVIVILVVRRFRFRWGLALTVVLAGGAAYGSWWAFETHRWLIDPALCSATLLAAALTCALMMRLHTEDEIRFVETQFGRRLSSSGLARVKASPRMIQAEGSLRDVTSVVVGLRGFNIISDRYLEDPTAYADILNRFFSPMTKIVQDRNGMVDRTVGDALYAVWNAPLDASNHASKGCDAALRMVENLEALNEFLEEDARRQHLSHVPLSRLWRARRAGELCRLSAEEREALRPGDHCRRRHAARRQRPLCPSRDRPRFDASPPGRPPRFRAARRSDHAGEPEVPRAPGSPYADLLRLSQPALGRGARRHRRMPQAQRRHPHALRLLRGADRGLSGKSARRTLERRLFRGPYLIQDEPCPVLGLGDSAHKSHHRAPTFPLLPKGTR
jgi:hypothetical protein